MKTVYIGSENPIKVSCVKRGFEDIFKDLDEFEFVGKSVDSGVGDQPMTNEETLLGAENRANNLRVIYPEGHFYVGIEGGIQSKGNEMEAFAWIVIQGNKMSGKAQTSTFQLPSKIVKLIHQGVELGHADDLIFNRKNSKQGNGAVGILTGNVIDRAEYYRHAIILALIPFINPELYN